MLKSLSIFYFVVISFGLFAQTDSSVIKKYAETISAADLKKHLSTIASADFEGRETGESGQKNAARYLIEYYKSQQIGSLQKDTYLQTYPISSEKAKGASLKINSKNYEYLKDFYFFQRFDTQELIGSSLIFAGYGIDDSLYSDYKNLDVRFKVVVIYSGEPVDKDGNYLLSKSKEPSKWNDNWRLKVETAREKGANCLLIIDNKVEENIVKNKHSIEKGLTKLSEDKEKDERLPFIFVKEQIAKDVLGKKLKKAKEKINNTFQAQSFIQPAKIEITITRDKRIYEGDNVIAFIPGSEFKDEYVVFSAHYDHLGKDGSTIYYGADDDGSGTVAVLEIAQAFVQAYKDGKGPKRNVLFINFSGEEKGLLGSEYFSQHPIVPLNQIVSDLNIDMIGRLDDKHKDNPNYTYIIGSDKLSSELHTINENNNKTFTKIELDYTFNRPNDPNKFYYRSDHYNFAKKNIPVIFFFTGVHADYHSPTDTVDKINFNKMEKITRLVFCTGWELANREKRIVVDRKSDFKNVR